MPQYELNLAIDIIKNENLRLTIRGNGSFNKNIVDGIKANNGKILNTPVAGGATYITQNGGAINEPYLYAYLGVNPLNGRLLFEDINGNPTENPIGADRKATGKNYIPQYQGGFGFDLDYKGFFVSSTFTFAQKVWRIDGDLANLFDPSNINTFTVTGELLNSWTPSNPNSNLPSLTASNAGAGVDSDRFLRDASYIRLRNFQIGYRVPKKYLDRTFFKDVSFTLQGENLFTFTKWQGIDVESSRSNNDVYQYPTPKIYTFGMDLKF
jgi:TonB-dependent starch-binding outer membrane protein SusC